MKFRIQTTHELKKIMDNSKINKHYFSIYPDENFYTEVVTFIRKKASKWEIGVKERCIDCDVKQFDTEAEACQAFLEEFYPEVLDGKK